MAIKYNHLKADGILASQVQPKLEDEIQTAAYIEVYAPLENLNENTEHNDANTIPIIADSMGLW